MARDAERLAPQGIFLALAGPRASASGCSPAASPATGGDADRRHATSRIATLAAGEVQVSGVIEPAELTLISPLQSIPCVYYRATIEGARGRSSPGTRRRSVEERAVGFRVRDASGDIRVFPSGARWDAQTRFDDSTGVMGDEPPGLAMRTGPAISSENSIVPPRSRRSRRCRRGARARSARHPRWDGHVTARLAATAAPLPGGPLEPGDAVTIVGRAMPFCDLADPAEADIAEGSLAADDPEVSGDIAEAREAGLLAETPEDAWGNAAIPGFGIGQPTARRSSIRRPRSSRSPKPREAPRPSGGSRSPPRPSCSPARPMCRC